MDGIKIANQMTLTQEDYPGFVCGPNLITSSLNVEEGGGRLTVRGGVIDKTQPVFADFVNGRGHWARNAGGFQKTADPHLEPQERNTALLTP